MSHDPLCNQHDVALKRPCPVCAMYAQARADERERIAVQLEEWADNPESGRIEQRSMRFTLTMAARAIRRRGQS